MRLHAAFIAAFALIYSSLVHADYVLSAAPRESAAEGIKTYGPLAERLSAVLGQKVVYEHPQNWADYSDNIRHDHYDILMDGPHLLSWRMKHTNFTPVARLPGHLAFKFVALKDNERFNDEKSIRFASVCAFATPNLTAVALLDRYRNQIITPPRLVTIRGKMKNILAGLVDKHCDVAVLRDQFYDKLSEEQKAELKVIAESREFPNQGISASKRLTEEQRQRILEVLQHDSCIKPITARFAVNAQSFIASEVNEYQTSHGMLEGVVWGW